MALSLSIEQPTKAVASYWRIATVAEDYGLGIEITLFGYVDADARQDGQPLAVERIHLTGVEYSADMDRAAMYSVIKSKPEWADATDC